MLYSSCFREFRCRIVAARDFRAGVDEEDRIASCERWLQRLWVFEVSDKYFHITAETRPCLLRFPNKNPGALAAPEQSFDDFGSYMPGRSCD
jgi:hypothetical protein